MGTTSPITHSDGIFPEVKISLKSFKITSGWACNRLYSISFCILSKPVALPGFSFLAAFSSSSFDMLWSKGPTFISSGGMTPGDASERISISVSSSETSGIVRESSGWTAMAA